MIQHLTAIFAGKPAPTGFCAGLNSCRGAANRRALQIGLILLLTVSMPLWAAEPKELDWPALIPEGAPVIPPQLAPLHDMSQLSDALSAESAPAARQQAPDAPVVKSLDGQQVKIPGYIVPLEVSEEGRTTEFCWCPTTAPASMCHRRRRIRSCMFPAKWVCAWRTSISPTGSRERCRLEPPAANWPTPDTRWKRRKYTLMFSSENCVGFMTTLL